MGKVTVVLVNERTIEFANAFVEELNGILFVRSQTHALLGLFPTNQVMYARTEVADA